MSNEFQSVREAIGLAVQEAGFRIINLEEMPFQPQSLNEALVGAIARADCVIADLSSSNLNVSYEIGMAQAMGKGIFLITQDASSSVIPSDLRGFAFLTYVSSNEGLSDLTRSLVFRLRQYRRSPRQPRPYTNRTITQTYVVDWDRLDRLDAENLCLELLTQMGFVRVNWFKESPEIDLVAELPKKDPDGYDYRELWLITMGGGIDHKMLLEIALEDMEYFLHRIFRDEVKRERFQSADGMPVPITLLFILLNPDSSDSFDLERLRVKRGFSRRSPSNATRVRVWDRAYLTNLVQQFPQIGYKYFSDEARSQAKYRKTPEELYRENIELTNRQSALIRDLENEKNRRVRAERDAAWKDIAFAAAHKIGNPIFAIETNLGPLRKRIIENRLDEAVEVIDDINTSVEKAKGIVDQFKSLSRAQEIKPVPTLLLPILEEACHTAENDGVICKIECPSDLKIIGDPDRLTECFDELVANSMRWFNTTDKTIHVKVTSPAPGPLPDALDTSQAYVLIHFTDNGPGVPVECKSKIFDAFFTTRDQGTGLGLALVRRIIEGHKGNVFENGIPGEGADFEIYLPNYPEPANTIPKTSKSRSTRRKE